MPKRIITIEIFDGPCGYNVIEDGRDTDRLSWDEMLGTVAVLTHQKIGESHYPMLTRRQWQEREEAMQRRRAERLASAVTDPDFSEVPTEATKPQEK